MTKSSQPPREDSLPATESKSIALVEEVPRVEKREVSSGKVRIRIETDSIAETVTANLEEQNIEVTRVPVDKVVTEAPAVRTEGEVTIIPVLEEVLVIQKQLVLKEELHVRRGVGIKPVEVPMILRKQRAVIERLGEAELHQTDEE